MKYRRFGHKPLADEGNGLWPKSLCFIRTDFQ